MVPTLVRIQGAAEQELLWAEPWSRCRMRPRGHMGAILRVVVSAFCLVVAGALGTGCAYRPSEPEVSLVTLEVDGQKYRLRSVYWPAGGESFNELIGPEFVARDLDQDGVLDVIALGERPLAEAQRIYERVLATLAAQNRLRQVEPDGRAFRCEEAGRRYELKTVRLKGEAFQNEFRVVRLGSPMAPELGIAIDLEADGVLDQLLKGELPLLELQRMYAACIERGVRQGRLERREGLVVVRQK